MDYIIPKDYHGKEWAKFKLKGNDGSTDVLVIKEKYKNILFDEKNTGKDLQSQIRYTSKHTPKDAMHILKSTPREITKKAEYVFKKLAAVAVVKELKYLKKVFPKTNPILRAGNSELQRALYHKNQAGAAAAKYHAMAKELEKDLAGFITSVKKNPVSGKELSESTEGLARSLKGFVQKGYDKRDKAIRLGKEMKDRVQTLKSTN